MLFTAQPAPKPSETELRSLRCSLNSPVVSISQLPVGPGSAAIAVLSDSDGHCEIAVAIQCRRTGGAVFFGARNESGSPARVDSFSTRAAMLWAEGMGFLFDDELCIASATADGADAAGAENEKGVRYPHADAIWRDLVLASDAASESIAAPGVPAARELASILSKFRWNRLGARASLQDRGPDAIQMP